MNDARINKVLQSMAEKNIPQMIISDPSSVFYATGKWIQPGERMLALYLSLDGNHKLFLNKLFHVPEDLGVEKVWFDDTDDSVKLFAQHINKKATIGIDKNWPSHFLLRLMAEKGDSDFFNGSLLVDRIRACKDDQERDLMREASRLNDLAIDKLIKLVPKRYTEKKLAQLLPGIYEELGADGLSFDPIISYGANAADPHHAPEDTPLKEGDCIILDIGCKKGSYCSDMTRTVFYKYASEHAKKVYDIVLEANKRAIAKVKPGARFCDIDAAARSYIDAAGYGKGFLHRTGHSIGLDVHDFGDVSSSNKDQVQPGMIFSIEPCVVVPGELGIRVEDLVLVTEEGCEVLNKYNKEMMIVE
ncbi:MAG TPA: Xaa-Pro peptidase family protein [Selenomonadales bacterium]|nr:Xaa-Pro peptidase family protein [Selenomonadales bacterium]